MNLLPRHPSGLPWEEFIEEAKQYHATASKGRKRPNVFTPEILYNILAMAIEKYFMGYLLLHKKLPDNHTMKDLFTAAQELTTLDDDLIKQLEYMDSFQEICSVDNYNRRSLDAEDIDRMVRTCDAVADFIHPLLLKENA